MYFKKYKNNILWFLYIKFMWNNIKVKNIKLKKFIQFCSISDSWPIRWIYNGFDNVS